MTSINVSPYDNDITLLYKWANAFQVPISLMIVRPRESQDVDITSGNKSYVYESLSNIVYRFMNEHRDPGEMYDLITEYNNNIREDDIAMVYYGIILGIDPNLDYTSTMNQFYRSMDKELTYDKFDNSKDLDEAYTAWSINIKNEFQINTRHLDKINKVQNKLTEINNEIIESENERPLFSPVIISSNVVSFHPKLNGEFVTPDDGLDIFNNAVVSRYVPFIRYNDSYGKSLFRVYTGKVVEEEEPNYAITIIPSKKASEKNVIYMTLWLGDDEANLHNSPHESFFVVIYNLNNNYLSIESPSVGNARKSLIKDEKVAHQRTMDALPSLNFETGREAEVKGEFNIWGIDFDETSFLHMVLIESIMNVYLYVEEDDKSFAFKKHLKVKYRSAYTDVNIGSIANAASISMTITSHTTNVAELVDIFNPIENIVEQGNLNANTPYIHIVISRAETKATIDNFISIFTLLIKFYSDNREQVLDLYRDFLPQVELLPTYLNQRKNKTIASQNKILELTRKKVINPRNNGKITRLQELAPELFVEGYARKCQCPDQPIIISPDEIGDWSDRQIMPFPKDNPKWYFVCPNDQNPYPKLKVNTLSNKEEFPYIPCCGITDKMSPGSVSHYRDYIEGKQIRYRMGAKADKTIRGRQIVLPGRTGALPIPIRNILKRYSDESAEMVRYGVVYSPNSLLHCVCTAIDDPKYFKLSSNEDRENYVIGIRQDIVKLIYPSLLKQELYDCSDAEIINLLRDPSKFFDPFLFYRAIEETYNINIYVFSPSSNPNGIELGVLEVPRFKIFHSRPIRSDRNTMVILKTFAADFGTTGDPQCELIVDYDEETDDAIKLFGEEMTSICNEILRNTVKTITWNILPDGQFDGHSNIYYEIDHLQLFSSMKAMSQLIDDNGKMRAINFAIGKTKQLMTIATIPSQPENLPIMERIERVPFQTAINTFTNQPTGVTLDKNGNVDGLWFQIMDIIYGEYVPILSTPLSSNEIGPPNPIVSIGISLTNRLRKLKRILNIIVQLIKWLYELARSIQGINIDPNSFAVQYMILYPGVVDDSSNFYDLRGIKRKLPFVATIEEGIGQLQREAPKSNLFDKGKIVMYNEVFRDRIIKMLRDYSNLRMGLEIEHIEYIDNYYETESDFINQNDAKIFMNETDLTSWLTSLKNTERYQKYFTIRQSIDVSSGLSPDPYFYGDSEGRIWIVQNVLGIGNIGKALAVAENWKQYQINIGYDPIPLTENIPAHIIYGISPASTLIPIEDNTNDEDEFVSIVYYGNQLDRVTKREGRFAALLEIL